MGQYPKTQVSRFQVEYAHMKTCPNCGQPALDWHRFCMRCGIDISAVRVSAAPAQYVTQPADPAAAQPPQQYYAAPTAASKSSNKTIWVIVGAVAILPAIAIVL